VTEPGSNRPIINPWIIAITVMLSTFLEVLDTSVVNVSLPHIAGSLSATVDEATWVLTSYLVANAIVLPITGWLANRFGRKRLLITAVSGFTLASLLCGIAPTLPALVVFRIIQGATGGALQPISQAILLESFPPQDRGKAMAFWGLGIVCAPILGPTLGGWLTDAYSWRWVFYINLPIGIASVFMTRAYIFDPAYIKRQAGKVDFWGLGMLAVGISALQIVLDKGQEADWFGSNYIIALTVLAAVLLTAFVFWELTINHPIVHLSVFKDRTYATGVFLMTLLGFVLYGSLVLLPIFMQTLLNYTAVAAGIWTSPRGIGALIFMPVTGILMSRRWDPRLLLGLGLAAGAMSMFEFSHFTLQTSPWGFFWAQILQGAALSFIFVPLTTVTMDGVSNSEMGNATSLFNLLRNLGGGAGISAMTTLVARRSQFHQARLTAQLSSSNTGMHAFLAQLQAGFIARGENAVTAGRQALGGLYGLVGQQAALLSFMESFWLLALIFTIMVPLVLLMRRPTHGRSVSAH